VNNYYLLFQHHFKYRNKHYITWKFVTLFVQTLKFIKMSTFITLKSIAFRWRHFKVNICCAHHYPVTQHGHIGSPRTLHPGTSHEKPDSDSKRNSIKCPRSPTNIGTDNQKPSPWKRLTRQTSLPWRCTGTSASTCKGPMVQQSKDLGAAILEASLVQRWIKIHAAEKRWPYTCLQRPEWEVRKELRPWGRQFRRRKCDDVGCHILRANWCTSPATLTPLNTEMRFWHHTCYPQWTSIWKFSVRQRSAAHNSWYCWLSSQTDRNSNPFAV